MSGMRNTVFADSVITGHPMNISLIQWRKIRLYRKNHFLSFGVEAVLCVRLMMAGV